MRSQVGACRRLGTVMLDSCAARRRFCRRVRPLRRTRATDVSRQPNLDDRSRRRDAASGRRLQRDRDAGADGALMIDGGLAANADALLAAVKDATRTTRIHTLINTHWHPEQTGANEAVGRDGGVIFAHEKTKMYLSNTVYSVTFKGRRRPLPEACATDKDHARRRLAGVRRAEDRLRLHARGAHRRRSLRPLPEDESAGRRRRRVRRRSGRCSTTAMAPGSAAAFARSNDSRISSNPTPASCPRMAA